MSLIALPTIVACSSAEPLLFHVAFSEGNGDNERRQRTCEGAMGKKITIEKRWVKKTRNGPEYGDFEKHATESCEDVEDGEVLVDDLEPVNFDLKFVLVGAGDELYGESTVSDVRTGDWDGPSTRDVEIKLETLRVRVDVENGSSCEDVAFSWTYADEENQLADATLADGDPLTEVCHEAEDPLEDGPAAKAGAKPLVCRALYRASLRSDRGLELNDKWQRCDDVEGRHRLKSIDPGEYELRVRTDDDRFCTQNLVVTAGTEVRVDLDQCMPLAGY